MVLAPLLRQARMAFAYRGGGAGGLCASLLHCSDKVPAEWGPLLRAIADKALVMQAHTHIDDHAPSSRERSLETYAVFPSVCVKALGRARSHAVSWSR